MPESPANRDKRLARWRHFGAIGSVRFAMQVCRGITTLPTASGVARNKAWDCYFELERLLDNLKRRVNPETGRFENGNNA